ncbi:hypothetical protein A9G45_09280 [Gilliamella sp. HK2]|jgi:hypothetical protein|uniref:hypothetical protein n=1 Tax=unclassified Gilliamella TaxID=2685620 RepID=UPI00080E5638|nr:hypothetical protein [Gilliamella apicola]OCG24541.1 hypothetical protein A9G46_08805 [Gilliamella apicola]OCG27543.1 hypothetical protein A9G45_09280 [Gilliamella apicola]
MLITIGIRGGSSVFILGTDSDMKLFFDCISYYLQPKYPEENWSILTDRLYRRYLKLEELDTAESLMKLVEEEFKQLDREAIDWGPILSGKAKSDLDRTKSTLYDIFNGYFYAFHYCVESAKINYEGFKSDPDYEYEPVMVAITTLPYSISYKYIPLSVFDNLGADEKPIWWTGKIPK